MTAILNKVQITNDARQTGAGLIRTLLAYNFFPSVAETY